jgi:uncharacterized membrane protein YeiB
MTYIVIALILIIYALLGFMVVFNSHLQIKKLFKIGFVIIGLGLVTGTATYFYVFHKPQRNIFKEKPAYIMSAEQLYKEFSNSEDSSYLKYADKVIELTGKVTDIVLNNNDASVTFLDEISGINCSFDSITVEKLRNELETIKTGDEITLKGKCDGYDMIMGVVLTRCVLIKRE